MAKKKNSRPIRKKREATLYALWRSIPLVFHTLPLKKLLDMGYDTDDEIFQKLVTCRTKTEFKNMFGLAWQTMVDWDSNKEILAMIDDFNKKSNVLKFKKDIDYSLLKPPLGKQMHLELNCGNSYLKDGKKNLILV